VDLSATLGEGVVPRAAARSRAELRRRLARLRQRAFLIAQCGVGAGLAWWIASDLLGHDRPFFAPVTAMICLGMSYGQRLRRVADVTLGVAVGVLTGDVFVALVGTGVWQIALVAMTAMAVATLFGAGMLLITQAGVQAVIITTLVAQPGQAFSRWIDAVIGGALALVLTLVAPAGPVRRPRQQAAAAVAEISAMLVDTVRALREGDPDLATRTLERARASEGMLRELRTASEEGMAVVRLSPLRRRHLPAVQVVADLLEPLDRAIRNLRVLVRRAAIATWRGERVPAAYLALLSSLAEVTADIATELGERRLPTASRAGLVAIGEVSAVVEPGAGLSSEVMRAQLRSMVVDLLMLTGLTYEQARDHVPEPMGPEDLARPAPDDDDPDESPGPA
jgi:uncharacterized membrane protein YgaE (UPF0421/DUF939 family)